MIFGAYCVGKVHNMLPRWYYDIWSILCNKVHNMLPWQLSRIPRAILVCAW